MLNTLTWLLGDVQVEISRMYKLLHINEMKFKKKANKVLFGNHIYDTHNAKFTP